ncbi:hypothetical protein [Sphingorhabdus sp.]|uniref:hypothetical protein n=1 Tax=Sphingorhabdus sp. TaxID=1902408 RepID=UPI0026333D92|nr:hypothetical protein [Sphingorhabdus sp.]MDH4398054.1 hypothetical protein [Sphingorhabdus sp.]
MLGIARNAKSPTCVDPQSGGSSGYPGARGRPNIQTHHVALPAAPYASTSRKLRATLAGQRPLLAMLQPDGHSNFT